MLVSGAMERPAGPSRDHAWRQAGPLLAWGVAWVVMLTLDGHLELANQALVLILASAIAAIWWGPALSAVSIVVAVLAFNVAFVPPRGTFSVDLHHHGVLLLAMVSVSGIITALMTRQRRLAAEAGLHARRSEDLRRFGDALRAGGADEAGVAALLQALQALAGRAPALLRAVDASGATGSPERWWGEPNEDEREGLRLVARDGRAIGPGTGRHEDQPGWFLPLRGLQRNHGAVLLRLEPAVEPDPGARAHAQALCDQLGAALERTAAEQAALVAREQAQLQALRNTLLSAVAHDHRTPLAAIVSAAGALHDQADRLDADQRRRLAATIVDEATQLARITDNTLQLARLDAVGGLHLSKDWESLEELVGSVMRRMRQRDPARRLRARVEPGLPLLRCDAVLMVQLIDNLVDNALKHGGDAGAVEVSARRVGNELLLAVCDRGPGVPPAVATRIFDAFSRGVPGTEPSVRGTGVGLALCRAIARAHGGELGVRGRRGGGACFELRLPVEPAPAGPADDGPGREGP